MSFVIHAMLHIDEESCRTIGENIQKPLWWEEKTRLLGNGRNKIFPSLEPPLS